MCQTRQLQPPSERTEEWTDRIGLFDWNEAEEDILKVDEEVARVDCPVLPRTETCHHLLLAV